MIFITLHRKKSQNLAQRNASVNSYYIHKRILPISVNQFTHAAVDFKRSLVAGRWEYWVGQSRTGNLYIAKMSALRKGPTHRKSPNSCTAFIDPYYFPNTCIKRIAIQIYQRLLMPDWSSRVGFLTQENPEQ